MFTTQPVKCALKTYTIEDIDGMRQLRYGQIIHHDSIRSLRNSGELTLVDSCAVNFTYGSLYAVGFREGARGMEARYWLRLVHIPIHVGEEYTGNSYAYMFLGYLEQKGYRKFAPYCAPIGEYGEFVRQDEAADAAKVNDVANAGKKAVAAVESFDDFTEQLSEHASEIVAGALEDIEKAAAGLRRKVEEAKGTINDLLDEGLDMLDQHARELSSGSEVPAFKLPPFSSDMYSGREKDKLDVNLQAREHIECGIEFQPYCVGTDGILAKDLVLVHYTELHKGSVESIPVLVSFGEGARENRFYEALLHNGVLYQGPRVKVLAPELRDSNAFQHAHWKNKTRYKTHSKCVNNYLVTEVVRPCNPADLNLF